MQRVTVIGSGNAFNSSGRAHACYLLQSSAGTLALLDCGPTSLLRLQERGLDLNEIDLVLLTHFHGDHFAGLPFLLLEWDLVRARRHELVVAGPPGVAEICRRLMDVCYPEFYDRLRFPIRFVELREQTQIASFHVRPYPITHRPESTGYRVSGPRGRTLAFSGDTALDERLIALMEGVDIGIIELSMFAQSEPPTAHVTLEELREHRPRLKVGRLVLSHIYDELAAAAAGEGLGEVASDGMDFHFD